MTPAMSPSSQPTLWRTCRVLANRKRLQTLAHLLQQPNQTVSAVAERMSLSMPATVFHPAANASASQQPARFQSAQVLTIFKLATGFTHPRRVEVVRALTNGADSFVKLQAAANLPARALSRHLAKLEARSFVKVEMAHYVATIPRHPVGRVLARLARR